LITPETTPSSIPTNPATAPDPNTTNASATLVEADEDILTYTVSDEAIEAAAGIERDLTFVGSGIAGIACCPG
jgi:hypothetical protein